MHEIIDNKIINRISTNHLNFFKTIFLETWIKFENEVTLDNKIDWIKEIKLLKNIKFITFAYLEYDKKINTKFFKEFIEEKNYWKQIWEYNYLVFFVKNNNKYFIYWVDCINKTKLKISSFKIDVEWFYDYKTWEEKFRNRTINEQLLKLKKELDWWKREVNRTMLMNFFEKKNLTEEFYRIYKDDIFEKIKESNISKTHNESDLNHFILLNLNRLLFIHFLDKKWDIFKNYDKKYWSFFAYLKHNKYKNQKLKNNFHDDILDVLFFEVFSKSKQERNINLLENRWVKDLFYELPYLNWWLFKKSRFDDMWFIIEDKQIDDFIEKIIDSYNFTIEEDTPLEVKISVDPELLWYIFEKFVNWEDWAIYTPKVEVDFMCRQAIVEYLGKKQEFEKLYKKEHLYKLVYREWWKKWDQEYGSFSENEIEKIFYYLEDLKIVDPACWSGAFLVGMLQTIIDIEDTIKEHHTQHYNNLVNDFKITNKSLFKRKKELIKNTLYWVDVKTWAVEIAKLRLWLSMILDVENAYFENEESKNIPLLPSFSFKIVCWDSIINMIGTEIIPIDFINSINIDSSLKNKIKKLISLKDDFYNNNLKDENIILNEEKQIYIDFLNEKIKFGKKALENAKNWLFINQTSLFWENQTNLDEKIEKISKNNIKQIEERILQNQELLNQIIIKNKLPFAWSIDFAEIYEEKWWFDILVWNPPYIRQEDIEDPNWNIKNKKEYKNLLEKTINFDFLDEVNKNFDLNIKVWWRSDLYVYFYFRGLKLINEWGIFAFITSNSWLDVDFWSSLQEFLLKFVDNITIYDNSAERSFANASINTIIAIFDKPRTYKLDSIWRKRRRDLETDFWKTKFINFKKSFEEVIFSENFREIEDIYKNPIVENLEEKVIKTWEISFRKKVSYKIVLKEWKEIREDDFRVVYIDNKSLFIDWSEKEETKLWTFYKYEWNKWGWKYLKAPDIFFTILEKWGNKLVKLWDIAEVKRWFTTWCNDFFYLPSKYFDIKENWEYFYLIPKEKWLPEWMKIEKEFLKPVIKSPKECKNFIINEKDFNSLVLMCNKKDNDLNNLRVLDYIKWGESLDFHKWSTTKSRKYWYELVNPFISNFIQWQIFDIKFSFTNSKNNFIDCVLNWVSINSNYKDLINELFISINCYYLILFVELMWRSSLWDWWLKLQVWELKKLIVVNPNFIKKVVILNREQKSIFEELWFDKTKNIRDQEPNPLSDRKELDDIIFDEIWLNLVERKEVYWSLGELVKSRLDKANSR